MNRTKEYIKMIIFVLVVGAVSAGLLVGIDILTKDRIAENQLFELYSAILDANEDEYSQATFIDVFENNYSKLEPLEETDVVVYQHTDTKNVSFEFEGGGMWGPIKGVITLEEDFLTIVAVRILEQEETPGLGARIGEEEFLVRFVGQSFPNITILKDREPVANNEIEGLTGATTTTGRFQTLLNANFMSTFRAYMGDALEQGQFLEVLQAMLEAHGIEVLPGDNVEALVTENFNAFTEGDLTAYVNNNAGLVSFIVEEDIRFGQNLTDIEMVPMVVTLRDDITTIDSMTAIYAANDGHWGKTQLLNNLDLQEVTFPLVGGESFNITGVTGTGDDLIRVLNSNYELYLPLLETLEISGGNFGEKPLYNEKDIKEIILNANGISLGNDVDKTFAREIITVSENGKTVYVSAENQTASYVIESNMRFGVLHDEVENVLVIVTLENDGVTIKEVNVIARENEQHLAKEALFSEDSLASLIGAALPHLKNPSFYAEYYFETNQDFELALNIGYDRHQALINKLDYSELTNFVTYRNVLNGHGYDLELLSVFEAIDLYHEVIEVVTDTDKTLHINKDSNKVTMEFTKDLVFGRNGGATENLDVTFHVTLASDFETILGLNTIHNHQSNHWGKRDLLLDEVLIGAVGMKFPNLSINEEDAFFDVTGVTLTGNSLEDTLNEAYLDFLPFIESQFTIQEADGLKLTTNNLSNNSTFSFVTELTFGNQNNELRIVHEDVRVFVTLNDDNETISNISVLYPEGNQWGKTRLLSSSNLANAKGEKFPNLVIKEVRDDGNYYFEATGVTATGDGFEKALNEWYVEYQNAFWGD